MRAAGALREVLPFVFRTTRVFLPGCPSLGAKQSENKAGVNSQGCPLCLKARGSAGLGYRRPHVAPPCWLVNADGSRSSPSGLLYQKVCQHPGGSGCCEDGTVCLRPAGSAWGSHCWRPQLFPQRGSAAPFGLRASTLITSMGFSEI